MSTGELTGGALQAAPSSGPSAIDLAGMAGEVARLANALFANSPLTVAPGEVLAPSLATPGLGALDPIAIAPPVSGPLPALGPLPPPRVGPSAVNVGGGGMSAAQTQPPMPGFLHAPPLAASPIPKEADVRPAPTLLAELFGAPTPLELMLSADSRAPSASPYFLEHAGVPQASAVAPGGAAPTAAVPNAAASAPGVASIPAGLPFGAVPDAPSGAVPAAPPFSAAPSMPGGLPAASMPLPSSAQAPGSLPSPNWPPSGAAPEGLPAVSRVWAPDFSRIADGSSAIPALGAPANPARASPGYAEPPRPAQVAGGTPPSDGYSPQLVPELGIAPGIFDAHTIKKDFPILEERVHGNKRLIWLDNAATTQKPNAVIERLSYFYEHENSNIHRAAHTLAARATDAYEGARDRVRRFLNAPTAARDDQILGRSGGVRIRLFDGARSQGQLVEFDIAWFVERKKRP